MLDETELRVAWIGLAFVCLIPERPIDICSFILLFSFYKVIRMIWSSFWDLCSASMQSFWSLISFLYVVRSFAIVLFLLSTIACSCVFYISCSLCALTWTISLHFYPISMFFFTSSVSSINVVPESLVSWSLRIINLSSIKESASCVWASWVRWSSSSSWSIYSWP